MKKNIYMTLVIIIGLIFATLAHWSSRIYACNQIYPLATRPMVRDIGSQCKVFAIVDSILGHPDRKYNIFY
jgi:hypothetical protein